MIYKKRIKRLINKNKQQTEPFLWIIVFLVNFPLCFVSENNFALKADNFRNNLASSVVPQKQFSNYNIMNVIIK